MKSLIRIAPVWLLSFFMLCGLGARGQTITSFTPATGPVGTLVTISGSNLGSPTAFGIGGTAAIVISNTGSTLVGMVMPGAATGSLSVTTAGGTATGSGSFTVTPTLYPAAQQGSKLVGTGNSGAGQQGYSVAVSADGNTAIVGGFFDNGQVGAAWIYTRSGGVWSQQGNKLVGTSNTDDGAQGVSVCLSADGNTAMVGGYADNGGIGAAWVYTRSSGVWSQQGSELVGTGATGAALQGASVSLSADGNTAMVGGYVDNNNLGAAWVYTRSSGVWSQQGNKLAGTGNTGTAYQGYSLSLSADGSTAIVGGVADNGNQGATWAFVNLTITTGAITGPLYTGSQVMVPYTVSAGFTAGNVFTAQLSNASGSFASPIAIGAVTATTAGSISCTVPLTMAAGTGYRIRLIASTPATTGSDNGTDLTVVIPVNALNFDGVDDNVALTTALPSGSSYTKEAWIYLTGSGDRNIISSTGNPFWITGNKLNAGNNNNFSVVIDAATFPTATWTHVAVTYNAATNVMVLYKNGVVVSASATAPAYTGNAIWLGMYSGVSYFSGNMDVVRVWNRALCQAEIANNMTGTLPDGQTGLVAYYKMNQGNPGGDNTGNTLLPDYSGNSNNGTLTAFTRTGSTSNFIASTVATSVAPVFTAPTASASTTTTQTISGSTEYTAYCADIANVTPSGASAVSGSVMAKVTIDGSVQS